MPKAQARTPRRSIKRLLARARDGAATPFLQERQLDGLHRQVFTDGREFPATFEFPAYLGYSVGRWEGDTLFIETSGILASRTPWQSEHSDQLRVVERFTRSKDGKTLTLTAMMTDPLDLREPVVIKHIWAWAPDQVIAPYDQCEIPTEVKKGVR